MVETTDSRLGFIDNVTFHPVPEPGTLGLLAVSLVALGMYRRWVVWPRGTDGRSQNEPTILMDFRRTA